MAHYTEQSILYTNFTITNYIKGCKQQKLIIGKHA